MRAGEQLRFDVHAKLSVSAPQPSSVCGAKAPQPASPRGSYGVRSALLVRVKAAAAKQRAGQAPPLRYD